MYINGVVLSKNDPDDDDSNRLLRLTVVTAASVVAVTVRTNVLIARCVVSLHTMSHEFCSC